MESKPKTKKGGLSQKKPLSDKAIAKKEKVREEEAVDDPEIKSKSRSFLRGNPVPVKAIADKKLKGEMKKTETKFRRVAVKAARAQELLTEETGFLEAEGMEKTYKFKQSDISENVDINSSRKFFELKLDNFGPYHVNYTRNGRHVLIGGKKGHIGAFDWMSSKLTCELHLKETVRDVQWLHNESLFAVAQKKYVYIYDKTGLEVHCLKDHIEVNKLEFLPYHFLLASVGNAGFLKYQDTSTGQVVAEYRTKLGPCAAMAQNPSNAIIHLGHGNGTVTLWSPSSSTPLVKMLCHRGPIRALAMDNGGNYMVTSGLDGQMKIWDIRNYKPVHEYFTPTPASSLSISQTGLLAVGYGPHIQVWKDAFKKKQESPYMHHLIPSSTIVDIQFCPFDDVLGVGHSKGLSSLIVPGAGEANIDAFEANPYQTKKQRQEAEVKSLLEKLQPDMITLDSNFIGTIRKASDDAINEARKKSFEANNPDLTHEPKKKMRGRNTSAKRYLRKQKNVIEQRKINIKQKMEREKKEREIARQKREGTWKEEEKSALDRFIKKKK